MCGIVGVVQGEESFVAVDLAPITRALEEAHALAPDPGAHGLTDALLLCAERVEVAVTGLLGVRGALSLAHGQPSIAAFERLLDDVWTKIEAVEHALDAGEIQPADVEQLNAALVRVKDAVWTVRRDCLRTATTALDLAGRDASPHSVALFAQIEIALSAIDRLEVRGRDSAGIAVFVRNHGLDLDAGSTKALLDVRTGDPLLRSGSVRVTNGNLGFVYKAAAEVGELGDNTAAIRDAVRADPLLHLALRADSARLLVLGHTRWASVGMISEPNAHPVASDHEPFIFAVLNGDIDNHVDITADEEALGDAAPPEITTDTHIIPVLVSRRLAEGLSLEEAFRRTVASFEGSVAIAAASLEHPDTLLLALRGSGQALYAGLSDGGYLVASEAYGFVEQARTYLRMDGDRGEVVILREPRTTSIDGITRMDLQGAQTPIGDEDLRSAEITTRDVDRGPFPHFLLKELSEAPRSFRQTLRGRLADVDGRTRVVVGSDTLPDDVAALLRTGGVRRIVVIGQGTAAIAGRALGATLSRAIQPATILVEATAATELSGFGLREDMSDTLVIAISQSGTTADTNRTVDVAKSKGAHIIAIVNRRQSDLSDRADGVLYTSDGRDVEMAVPSTKAFYAQVAAGFVLAAAIAGEVPGATGVDESALSALRDLPEAMETVLADRSAIAEVARRHVPYRRDWAVVGNGPNRIAAEELRIKLSELCYKSISSDVTEDKKHIDLSAEPLILVCAAGLLGSNALDVAKEIVYYRAHKAAPIVICGEGEGSYDAALDVIRVPSVHPGLAFLLSAMAGHVFGYEAALVIDALAGPLRDARSAIEAATETEAEILDPLRLLERVRPALRAPATRFNDGLRTGSFDGHLEPSTAVRIASLFRYATGVVPLDAYQIEHGKIGTPTEVLGDLMAALTTGIDKLTRPVDAIRHQAKTVTVGISRAEETLLQVGLVKEVLAAGVARDRLTYGTLRELAALDPSIDQVLGYTLYRVEGDVEHEALIRITDRGGIARDIPSRTDQDPSLVGTKHRVAVERQVLVTRGARDGRTVVLIPEVKGAEVTGILLLHVKLHQVLPADVMRGVLQGYRGRYSALRDTVTESEPTFRDDLLGEIPVGDLLISSILALAERWRQS